MRCLLQMFLIGTLILCSSCGHRREIQSFGSDLESAASDMAQTIDGDPSARGVKAAYDNFQKSEGQLHARWTGLLVQKLSEQDKSDLSAAVFRGRQKLTDCFTRHTDEISRNARFGQAISLVRNDFDSQFKLEDLY